MIRVRFAPSPTGFLHIGNVRTALFNYLFARGEKGKFILRIEDTDKERSRKECVDAIYEDLAWLGIEWDEGPDKGGDYGPYLQSERIETHQKYAQKLIDEGLAYHCYCSEEDLETRRKEQLAAGNTTRYDNRCRILSVEDKRRYEAQGKQPCVRFKVDQTELTVKDIIRGDVEFDLSLMGDFVIVRPDGTPTFHLAVCVDDGLMKITHVVRGEDHLSNTPRHVLLFKACGFAVPEFAHMPLTMGPGGEPLSKRLGAMSIFEYRKLGYPAEALRNYMALLGWSSGDDTEIFSMKELVEAFSLKRVSRSASIFDKTKMHWMCGEHIRMMSDEEYVRRASHFIVQEHIVDREVYSIRPEWYERVLLIFKDYLANFAELEEHLKLFGEDITYEKPELLQTEQGRLVVEELEKHMLSLETVGEEEFSRLFKDVKKRTKCKGKDLFMPARVAMTGREHGPDLKMIFILLGKTNCLRRLAKAVAIAKKEISV